MALSPLSSQFELTARTVGRGPVPLALCLVPKWGPPLSSPQLLLAAPQLLLAAAAAAAAAATSLCYVKSLIN